jgi:hypothetical protein
MVLRIRMVLRVLRRWVFWWWWKFWRRWLQRWMVAFAAVPIFKRNTLNLFLPIHPHSIFGLPKNTYFNEER